MGKIQSVGGIENLYSYENQTENLEKALEDLSDYLCFSKLTGWSDVYGAYLILREIFSKIDDPGVITAFSKFENKIEDFAKKRCYFTWNHIELSELIDGIQDTKPTICSARLKIAIASSLEGLLSEVDEACNGAFNKQFALSLIFGKLIAIGFILCSTQLSANLREKGKEITERWHFPRFGDVAPHLKLMINELLDLLSQA